jgi:hypothetical protein
VVATLYTLHFTDLLLNSGGAEPQGLACDLRSARIGGTNAKIRAMQRRGYGFRDEEYLKLKILASHESKISYAA